MVVPIRELRNIIFSTATTHSTTNNIASIQDIDMVVNPLDNLFDIGDNFNEVRNCSLALSAHRPRSPSISSSNCNKEYHIQVKRESDKMNENKPITSIGSIQIKYMTQEGQNSQVSKAADNTNNVYQ